MPNASKVLRRCLILEGQFRRLQAMSRMGAVWRATSEPRPGMARFGAIDDAH
jgi:hypothetical protein